jgi:DNA-nicking Smr family endonuclease
VSKSGRGLSDEEKKLWRRVAARVKARRPVSESPQQVAFDPPKRAAKSAVPSRPPPSKPRAVTPPPQDRGAERRVRRGKLEIAGKLDLHGHTQDTGRAALLRFLHDAHARGARTVIVITGVGRGGEGVLKRRLPEWLAAPDLRPLVSGFAQAHRTHGGEGAYYVFLRSARTT